jgi:hypothetical protein
VNRRFGQGAPGWLQISVIAASLFAILICSLALRAEPLTADGWELLAIGYPDGRDVTVVLGGGAKTLTAKGLCKVKWRKDAAALELELDGLPAPADAGWAGAQYVLWAIDNENRILNLGLVPTKGKEAKWKMPVPLRIFGLLVTAEKNPQSTSPSADVVLESLLPTDPNLVVPVFRVTVTLTP